MMNKVLLQLERLRRHHHVAVNSYDQVALFDLSHTLRIWVDLKQSLPRIAPQFATTQSFKTAAPPKAMRKFVKGSKHIMAYMPGAVFSNASNGEMLSGPDIQNSHDRFSMSCKVRHSPPKIEFSHFGIIWECLDDAHIRAIDRMEVKRCNYVNWLGSEAVRICFQNSEGSLVTQQLSRENVIKRVANTMDGSHPSANGVLDDGDNRFDEAIQYLMLFKCGGLPIPYFLLLKVAQDILEIAPRLLQLKEQNSGGGASST